jgi:hypothetical protein
MKTITKQRPSTRIRNVRSTKKTSLTREEIIKKTPYGEIFYDPEVRRYQFHMKPFTEKEVYACY